ncbi:hypothetical protein SH501x_000597 [Pirellulaceae bacterium SH501]
MKKLLIFFLSILSIVPLTGCESGKGTRIGINAPDAGHHDLIDVTFRRRHRDLKGPVEGDPMLEIARELTVLEDDIRRDGSITVKDPDVWGDGNLIAAIQEYEQHMGFGDSTAFDKRFSETVQAYIARSDQGEFQSVTAIAAALGGQGTATLPSQVSATSITNAFPESLALTPSPANNNDSGIGVGLEPTELDRERSTFILANQGLRRRMIGDDNSRAAGYGLYLFRIPVSVLPGRETTEGYSAVVTLRAQLSVDRTHLRNTFSRMVIADLIETLTPTVMANWDRQIENSIDLETHSLMKSKPSGSRSIASLINVLDQKDVLGEDFLACIVPQVRESLDALPEGLKGTGTPKPKEIERVLEAIFSQAQIVMEENNLYAQNDLTIKRAGEYFIKGQHIQIKTCKNCFVSSEGVLLVDEKLRPACWMLAMQSAILDCNLKRILKDMSEKGQLSPEQFAMAEYVSFYLHGEAEAQTLWEALIRESFPLHVFNLDPIHEQQNAYDSFSRRREMQVALAFGVAQGNIFALDQKLKLSRQLALDEATIALNRTAVAFAHGDDTFGWYFHPRVQTPPVESSNIGALARTIWSTGPTERYDRKHRRLEPGIRDCEVLIAMPAFVTDISFDVTTNWEKLTKPGVTKRSYEEMVAQGGRLHRLRQCLVDPSNQNCYRPGEYARLISRIDQLEHMLGLQTHQVRLPFDYRQTGTGLFDTGSEQIAPSADYFYGLSALDPAQASASFFIVGKNFHPTLTHVIVGGAEYHTALSEAVHVEVISQELLHVKVGSLITSLSPSGEFEVRVATPAGMSNPLSIKQAAAPPQAKKPEPTGSFQWAQPIVLAGVVECTVKPNCACNFCLTSPPSKLRLLQKESSPFAIEVAEASFSVARVRKGADGAVDRMDMGSSPFVALQPLMGASGFGVTTDHLLEAIQSNLSNCNDFAAGDVLEIRVHLRFPGTPHSDELLAEPITITLTVKE